MLIVNQNQGAVNGVSETAPRFGVVTAPGLTPYEKSRLQGAIERAKNYEARFAAIMPEIRATNPSFAAMLDAVPANTDFDFTPLFEAAKERPEDGTWSPGDCYTAAEYRGKMWVPDFANLGDAYNGPLGGEMEPFCRLPGIWELAKRHAEAEEAAAFGAVIERDCALVVQGLGGDPLGLAALKLAALAFGGERDCFRDSQTDEMPANLAALRLIRVALDELDGMAANSVIDRREWVREELARVEAISRELNFAPVLEVETPDAE